MHSAVRGEEKGGRKKGGGGGGEEKGGGGGRRRRRGEGREGVMGPRRWLVDVYYLKFALHAL